MRIDIINGPNLNLLGERQPDIYGKMTLADIETACRKHVEKNSIKINFRQSNSESALIEAVQTAHREAAGLIINAAGYSHSSVSLLDALLVCKVPTIEVHISNIFARESFRHKSLLSPAVSGLICGLGAQGYLLALDALAHIIAKKETQTKS